MVWLAQEPDDAELRGLAEEAAAALGLPLTVVPTGHAGLERALADLVAGRPGSSAGLMRATGQFCSHQSS